MIDSSTEHQFDATTETALDRAAQLLTSARMPLIYGLTEATLEAQAVAVDIAETLRCIIDTPASLLIPQRGTMLQLQGGAHTTKGEAHKYADLFLVFSVTYADVEPERKLPFPPNQPILQVIWWTDHESEERNYIHADLEEFNVRLDEWLLYLQDSPNLEKHRLETSRFRNRSNNGQWITFYERFKSAQYPLIKYVAGIFASGLGLSEATLIVSRIESLAIQAARTHRAAASRIELLGNLTGAEYILTARTGAPCAVSFASGTAEFSPLDYAAHSALMRGLVDVALFIGDIADDYWPAAAMERYWKIKSISLEWRNLPDKINMSDGNIFIHCRSLEEDSGTILREDGVPIPLRPKKQSNLPSLERLLKRLLEKIKSTKHF